MFANSVPITVTLTVCELHFEGELDVEHIDSNDNVADLLTKPVDRDKLERFRSLLLNR